MADVRLRWSGHRLGSEINLAVSLKLTVADGHAIAVAELKTQSVGLLLLSIRPLLDKLLDCGNDH